MSIINQSIRNRKFLPILVIISGILLFLSFQSFRSGDNNDPGTKYERIVRNVGLLLEQGHYSPREIDDSFSHDVFKTFIKDLDEDKSIFMRSDIDQLKKYESTIDNEIHGTAKLESFFGVIDVYNKRTDEASKLFEGILEKPFDYSKDETVTLDGDKLDYATDEQSRYEVWRKKLKYLSLSKYVDMLDDRSSDKSSASSSGEGEGVTLTCKGGKVAISVGKLKKKISSLMVERSADTSHSFVTVAKIDNPVSKEYTVDDENASDTTSWYYKAFFVVDGHSYKTGYVIKKESNPAVLERKAREAVRKQIARYFTTLKNHNTTDELFSTFVNAITSTMDPHSDYFAPIDQRSFNEAMSGSFFGIGAQLKEEEGKIKIASLVTGSPAWKSGEIQPGDEIIKIGEGNKEPVDVTGYAVVDAVKLIRGSAKGSEVRLTMKKPDGTVKVVPLLRDQIKLDDTFAKSAVINGEHKIGYIYLPEFYIDFEHLNGAKCSEDVAKEVEKLKAEKVDGIIIDLRSNGGGSLPEVVKMAGLFIDEGPICQVKGRNEKPYQWRDREKGTLYDGPLSVMVDENSASASEIFAAAIQDYKRGVVIGSSSTYGKGTVQRSIPLNPESDNDIFKRNSEDLGTVKLTLQKFYRINGGSTQLKGVTPDIIVPDRYEFVKSREKDNVSALGWDEIPKADYKTWVSSISTDLVASQIRAQIDTSTVFTRFKECIKKLDKLNDKSYSLQIDKYKAEMKELKELYKEMDDLTKLSKDLNVSNLVIDADTKPLDKEKTERNKQFINKIKSDIYIDETVKVMDKMIEQASLAKTN